MPRQRPLIQGYREGGNGANGKLFPALRVFATLWIAFLANPVRALAEDLCPTISVIGDLSPSLSDTEKRLVCGDPSSEAWKYIPPLQAKFQFRSFLQQRGFLHPQFTEDRPGHLSVTLGPITEVTQLTAENAPPGFEIGKRRKVVGQNLTPSLLDQVEKWSTQQMEQLGYPCSEVRATGDPETGIVTARIQPGLRKRIIGIEDEGAPGIYPGLLRRYDAFHVGDYFNSLNQTVSSNRIVSNGLYDSATFNWTCRPDGVILKQSVVTGPPRLLTVGVGANTEGLLIGKATWRNSRLGLKASSINVSLYASFIEQKFTAFLQWYAFQPGSRQFIRPLFEVDRQNEKYFTALRATTQLAYQTGWDSSVQGGLIRLGPSFEYIHTIEGTGPPDSRFLQLSVHSEEMSHQFEFYRPTSRGGHFVSLDMNFADRHIGSTATANRMSARATKVWNFRDYDPPLWLFGLRGGLDVTFTPERTPGTSQYTNNIPVSFLHFLGGSQNIRGFGRNELPTDGIGRLTAAYVGTEVRFGEILPLSIEPFIFYDFGALGVDPMGFDPPIYSSPGVGLRWTPVFGIFRATLAHGYPSDVPGHFQVYVSFGEDF